MSKIMKLDTAACNRPVSWVINLIQFSVKVYTKFMRDAGLARAGNLAFSTLTAAVPFAALILSLMTAFGALDTVKDQVTDFMLRMLLPTRQAEVTGILNQFLENTNTLGVVGLVFFSITSIALLNSININLNAVWGSKVKTNFMNKFTTYASVIIFGSLLLAASTTLTSRFSFAPNENLKFIIKMLMTLAPFIFDFLVIMLLIGLTPSGRIQLRYLLFVSALGAVFWELLKFGFFTLSSWALRMSVIYGTIAIIPIFLFWIYIIWLIIIFALEIAWVLQHKDNAWNGATLTEMRPSEQLNFGLGLFMYIAESYNKGSTPPNSIDLSDVFSVSLMDVVEMTAILSDRKMIIPAGEDGKAWIPARSLDKIRTIELFESVYSSSKQLIMSTSPVMLKLNKFYEAGTEALGNTTVADLLQEPDTVIKDR